jgi:hypothetical protein
MIDEDKYLKALAELSNNYFNEKEWLINNFELYKSTLNWPYKLPPIRRSFLIKGTLKEKFNTTYEQALSKLEYELDHEKQILILK